jgi:hypothetical protein
MLTCTSRLCYGTPDDQFDELFIMEKNEGFPHLQSGLARKYVTQNPGLYEKLLAKHGANYAALNTGQLVMTPPHMWN